MKLTQLLFLYLGGAGRALCLAKTCDRVRHPAVLGEFPELSSGRTTSLSPRFKMSHTETSHANRILILLFSRKWHLASLSSLVS